MEKLRSKSSLVLWLCLAALVSQCLGRGFEDQKTYYPPGSGGGHHSPGTGHHSPGSDPGSGSGSGGSPPHGHHGHGSSPGGSSGNCGTPPSSGGGGSYTPTPSTPTYTPTPTTPSTPTPDVPTPVTPTPDIPTPTTPTPVTPTPDIPTPSTPIDPGTPYTPVDPGTPSTPIDPGTPSFPGTPLFPGTPSFPGFSPPSLFPPLFPDPNSSPFFPCSYWRSNPDAILSLLGWWGTMGSIFSLPSSASISSFPGSSLTCLQALSNTRNDGLGALYREGTASLLNSMVSTRFPITTEQVRQQFISALGSDRAAASQAQLFKQANEGKVKKPRA